MNKNTKILLGAFIVLLAIYLLFFRSKDRISSDKIDAKLFVADSSRIDKIEFVKTGETFTIEKMNGNWVVTKPVNYPADTNAITPILGNLKNFTIEGVASDKPEKFPSYLDSANHTIVTVYQEGKQLGTFEIGKMAVSMENSFIKKPDDNRILIASGINSANFNKTLADFRSKYITSIPGPMIKSIKFQSTDSNKVDYEVVQDTVNHWVIGKDSVAHVNIDAFINMLGNMNTEGFKDTTMTTFPVPTWTITIGGTQPTTINFYKEKTEPVYYIMQITGKTQLFRISDAGARQWFKKKTDFQPPPQQKVDINAPKDKKKK
jgi:hypothetical protein